MEDIFINNEYFIRSAELKDLNQMIDIFNKGYLDEGLFHKKLPNLVELEANLNQKLIDALNQHNGWVMIHNKIVVGYLLGFFTGHCLV